MSERMSRQVRKEILLYTRKRYKYSLRKDKRRILDEFVSITGYQRKYAIYLLSSKAKKSLADHKITVPSKKKYNDEVKEYLLQMWMFANQICSKRLVPFIPSLLGSLERFGHLKPSPEVRNLLLAISPATADRLLRGERRKSDKKGLSTTCAGNLLKKQIKVRTFADWNDVVPGFMEGDLVAHCGDTVAGGFLNTLVLTDIASSWTEFIPILHKKDANIIEALHKIKQLVPFPLLGLDTDNGSEFINYKLVGFCKKYQITFTRSRAYKKNDQAHVEEKNGSIIRRLIGYDRYEGLNAYEALVKLYKVLRLYINYFQPSLKLMTKTREGAKVTKRYDQAKTPYQRLISSEHITTLAKEKLKKQYETLDPVKLLKELENLQNNFWQYACNTNYDVISIDDIDTAETQKKTDDLTCSESQIDKTKSSIRYYNNIKRIRKKSKVQYAPRSAISKAWNEIVIRLENNPGLGPKSLLDILIQERPEQFKMSNLRSLQKKIKRWKLEKQSKS